ncbi:hypothetical protein GCM10009845_22560 [Pedococcus bigeumensis]
MSCVVVDDFTRVSFGSAGAVLVMVHTTSAPGERLTWADRPAFPAGNGPAVPGFALVQD